MSSILRVSLSYLLYYFNRNAPSVDMENDVASCPVAAPPTPLPRRGLRPVMTPLLAATLDRVQLTDRKAVMVIAATAQSLGHKLGKKIITII